MTRNQVQPLKHNVLQYRDWESTERMICTTICFYPLSGTVKIDGTHGFWATPLHSGSSRNRTSTQLGQTRACDTLDCHINF